MTILGIDTATSQASVALLRDDEMIAKQIYPESESTDPSSSARQKNHSEILIPLIKAVLDEAGIALRDLAGVAVSIGPGSFTGVRIGLSTAKGIAFGCEIPLIGISTLQAYAATEETSQLVCALLDARKDEVYMAIFQRQDGRQERLTDDLVLPIAQAVEYLGQHIDGQRCALTGEGAYRFREHFERALGERVQVQTKLSRYLAASVAQLGRERIGAGARDDLSELTPAYVSLSQPEVKRQLADKLSV